MRKKMILNGKSVEISADVDNPVRGIYTQEEFDDLTEEQKTSGTYFVGDGGNDAAKLLKIVSNGGFLGLPVGPQGPAGPDGNPIGTIISYMGLTAPKDYLICDGATYPITDYPDLADFFQAQFGSKNHFGGDGTITFAVPDMRNLFLRGYHGEAEEQLSDEIGAKQDATSIPAVEPAIASSGKFAVGSTFVSNTSSQAKTAKNYDTSVVPEIEYWSALTGSEPSRYENAGDMVSYTPRPVNMAVLYCIKAAESFPGGNVYSTEEIRIGTWFDKPLYRKVVPFENISIPSNTMGGNPIIINNYNRGDIDILVSCFCCHRGRTRTDHVITTGNILGTEFRMYNNHTNDTFRCSGYFTLEYTKTTD